MNKENYVIIVRNKKYIPVKIERSKKSPDRLSIKYHVDSINNTILRNNYVMTMVNTYKSYVPDMVIRSNAFAGCIEITFDYIPIYDDNVYDENSFEYRSNESPVDEMCKSLLCNHKQALGSWNKCIKDPGGIIKAYNGIVNQDNKIDNHINDP